MNGRKPYIYVSTDLYPETSKSGQKATENGDAINKSNMPMQSSAFMLNSLLSPVTEHADEENSGLRKEGEFEFLFVVAI
jgi:hypothetical protein